MGNYESKDERSLPENIAIDQQTAFNKWLEGLSNEDASLRISPETSLINVIRFPHVGWGGVVPTLWKENIVEGATELEEKIADESCGLLDMGYRWGIDTEEIKPENALIQFDYNEEEKPFVELLFDSLSEIRSANRQILEDIVSGVDISPNFNNNRLSSYSLNSDPTDAFNFVKALVDEDITNRIEMKKFFILKVRNILNGEIYNEMEEDHILNNILKPLIERIGNYALQGSRFI